MEMRYLLPKKIKDGNALLNIFSQQSLEDRRLTVNCWPKNIFLSTTTKMNPNSQALDEMGSCTQAVGREGLCNHVRCDICMNRLMVMLLGVHILTRCLLLFPGHRLLPVAWSSPTSCGSVFLNRTRITNS